MIDFSPTIGQFSIFNIVCDTPDELTILSTELRVNRATLGNSFPAMIHIEVTGSSHTVNTITNPEPGEPVYTFKDFADVDLNDFVLPDLTNDCVIIGESQSECGIIAKLLDNLGIHWSGYPYNLGQFTTEYKHTGVMGYCFYHAHNDVRYSTDIVTINRKGCPVIYFDNLKKKHILKPTLDFQKILDEKTILNNGSLRSNTVSAIEKFINQNRVAKRYDMIYLSDYPEDTCLNMSLTDTGTITVNTGKLETYKQKGFKVLTDADLWLEPNKTQLKTAKMLPDHKVVLIDRDNTPVPCICVTPDTLITTDDAQNVIHVSDYPDLNVIIFS